MLPDPNHESWQGESSDRAGCAQRRQRRTATTTGGHHRAKLLCNRKGGGDHEQLQVVVFNAVDVEATVARTVGRGCIVVGRAILLDCGVSKANTPTDIAEFKKAAACSHTARSCVVTIQVAGWWPAAETIEVASLLGVDGPSWGRRWVSRRSTCRVSMNAAVRLL